MINTLYLVQYTVNLPIIYVILSHITTVFYIPMFQVIKPHTVICLLHTCFNVVLCTPLFNPYPHCFIAITKATTCG
jgi:hypothetical protein